MALAARVEVRWRGELLFFRTTRQRPITLGPSPSDTVPTAALKRSLVVLVPGKTGYGLRLGAPLMRGQITTGDRRLRIRGGLLLDPRPEPLLLGDGDHGRIHLDRDLTVEFHIQQHRQARFTSWMAVDKGLVLSLAVAALMAAVGLVVVAPWDGRNEPRHARTTRLKTRPAILEMARFRPPPPPTPPGHRIRPLPASTHPAPRARTSPRRPTPRGSEQSRRGQSRRLAALLRVVDADRLARTNALRAQEILTSVVLPLPGGSAHPAGDLGFDKLLDQISPSAVIPLAGGRLDQAPGARVGRRPGGSMATPAPAAAPDPGNPSREAIRQVVAANRRGIRLCFERELIGSPRPVQGRLLLRWEIDGRGVVTRVSVVTDTVKNQALRECVVSQIQSWRFPPCTVACSVTYPFDFFPQMS